MDANNREFGADKLGSDISSQPAGGASGTAARMKKNISDKAEDAKESLNEFGRKAADKLESGRSSTASALEWTAGTLHSRADQISDFTHSTADRLQDTADYVRENDFQRMVQDVQSAVKRYPGPALAVAAVLGFLIARGLRNIGD